MIRGEITQGEFVYLTDKVGPDRDGVTWVQVRRRRIESISDDRVMLSGMEQIRFVESPPDPLVWESLGGMFGAPGSVTLQGLGERYLRTCPIGRNRKARAGHKSSGSGKPETSKRRTG